MENSVIITQNSSSDTENNKLADIEEFKNLQALAQLTQKQKTVLYYMLLAFDSVDLQTDLEIAKKAGVDASTIWHCKQNAAFITSYNHFIKEIAKTRTGTVINRLYSMTEKSEKAIETFLKYTDQLINKSQNINANLNYNTNNAQSHLQNLIDMLKAAGYTKERLIAEIDEIWNQ